MRFFLDENFPKRALTYLESEGHQAFDIRNTEHEGCSDSEIFSMAQAEEACFLTTDKDFFHTIPFLFDFHHGVIIVALKKPNGNSILAKLEWLLASFGALNPTQLAAKIYLLEDKHFLVRDASRQVWKGAH